MRSYYCVKDGYLDVINPLLEITQLSTTKTRTDHQRDNWPWSGISGKYFLQLTRTLDHERQQILRLKSVFLENDPESRTKKIFTYEEKESQGKQQNILWSGTLLENKQLTTQIVCGLVYLKIVLGWQMIGNDFQSNYKQTPKFAWLLQGTVNCSSKDLICKSSQTLLKRAFKGGSDSS